MWAYIINNILKENVGGVNTGERGQRQREQKSMNGGLEGVKLCKGAIAVGEGETDGGVREGNLLESNKS